MSDAANHFSQRLKYEIDSWDLHQSLSADKKIIILDARSREAFEAEHIPQAFSLPHREMSAETAADFDRDALYVTYCDGIGCNASTKGALGMTQIGFTAKELIGGLDWWKRDGYPTERAVVKLET